MNKLFRYLESTEQKFNANTNEKIFVKNFDRCIHAILPIFSVHKSTARYFYIAKCISETGISLLNFYSTLGKDENRIFTVQLLTTSSLIALNVVNHRLGSILGSIILETAVRDDKVMQDFELESFANRGRHSLMVKAPPIRNDYGSKDCVNLSSPTAVSRIISLAKNVQKLGYSLYDQAHTFKFRI